jgi:hypothetical protein
VGDGLSVGVDGGAAPRTIQPSESHENGDVEALNGALKRRLEQHLLLRGGRDFDSIAAYEAWVQEVLEKTNRLREKRLRTELEAMRPLSLERLSGRGHHRVNYRHVIGSLVKKPGAFPRYRYRDEFFPTPVFRRAYDVVQSALGDRRADIEYLRILHLAASTIEADVETALSLLEEEREVPRAETVKSLVSVAKHEIPELPPPVTVDLHVKDPMTTAAAIDRIVHHAVILELSGSSYRSEAASKRAKGAVSEPEAAGAPT